MRFLLPTLALVLFLPSPAEAQIKKETSEVTNTTRWVSTDMRPLITEAYPGDASFRTEYEATDADTTWKLIFYGFGEQATDVSTATRVRMRVDGQAMPAQEVVRSDTRSLDGSVLEIKGVTFRRSAYERIAEGGQVTAFIGSFQFELTDPVREDLRLILERVPDGDGAPTANSIDEGSNR